MILVFGVNIQECHWSHGLRGGARTEEEKIVKDFTLCHGGASS